MRKTGARSHPSRRVLLQHTLLLSALGWPALAGASPKPSAQRAGAWADWDTFAQRFLQPDGRVLANAQGQTHSEAQSYALMFALIANDRPRFKSILRWTEDNLCAGDVTTRLPAWLWGQKDDGQWGVLDSNAASDADVWIAYALIEAGRLWNVRRYRALGRSLAERILAEETADLPGLGHTLLPGPVGFVVEAGQRWRLNPSYLPLQVLQALALEMQEPGWQQLADASLDLLVRSAPAGITPDWTLYDSQQGFLTDETDTEAQGRGGYNAIRTYLWAGMLHPQAPGRAQLLRTLAPMAAIVERDQAPPEYIHPRTLVISGPGPSGFSAAMLPFLQAQGASRALDAQRQRLQAQPLRPTAYYEQCLALFGQGWMRKDYAFTPQGQLQLPWYKA